MSDESVRINRGRRKLTLAGNITIADAPQVHQHCVALLERTSKVTMDLRALERVDTAILQLFLAFRRAAREQKVPVAWQEPGEAVLATARRVGLREALATEAQRD